MMNETQTYIGKISYSKIKGIAIVSDQLAVVCELVARHLALSALRGI